MFPYDLSVLGNIIVLLTVSYFLGADPICIVVIGVGIPVGSQSHKLFAVLPCQVGVELLTVAVVVGLPISSYTGAWVVYP